MCGIVLVSAAVPMLGSNSSHSWKSLIICLDFDPNIETAALTNTTPHICKSTKIIFAMRITCTYNRYCVMHISCPVYFINCNYIQKLCYVVITIIHAGTSVTDLSQGLHHYKVLPQGCDRGRFTALPFKFTIE